MRSKFGKNIWAIQNRKIDFIRDAKQNDTYLSYRAKGNKEYYGDNCNEIACDDFNIVGYFFVSFGEGKLSTIYEKSQRMAEAICRRI